MKKPVVVVNNKPLTRIDSAEAVNSGEQHAETKMKVKNETNISTEVSTSEFMQPSTSKLADEKKNESEQKKPDASKNEPKSKALSKRVVPKQVPPQTSQNKPKSIEKFKAKHKDPLKKVAHKTIDKKNKPNKNRNDKGLSDERLKAFGINPKKFNKKQKYAAQNQQKVAGKKGAAASKHQTKLKSKLKKALQG